MNEYALNEQGDVIAKLEEGHNFQGPTFKTEQELGNGNAIEKNGYRCYKFTIKNDVPVENKIKRWGIPDGHGDIISDVYNHDPHESFYEIPEDYKLLNEKYGVPQYHVDGSVIKLKPDIKDRPEFAAACKIIDDNDIRLKIAQKFHITKELEIMKGYMDWLNDGKPENDQRETDYNNMQAEIDTIKNA
jgi:hypothetical protein